MNLKSLATVSAPAFLALLMTSCGTTGKVDVVNPTVAQLDALDVQWGLPKRTTRGGVRRFDSGSTGSYSAQPAAAPASAPAPAAPAPRSEPAAAPASAPAAVDPNVIKSLR